MSLAGIRQWVRGLLGADPRTQGLVAFLLYLFVAIVLWGSHVLGRLGSSYVGIGHADAKLYIWLLYWWPYALSHGLDPLFTHMAWAPGGVNMAWVTGLPGPSLLMTPVTLTLGPVVSANLLMLLAPALAGWAAYLVCRRLTRAFWPSVAGGYLFGLSTYMVNQMQGHLNLVLIFPVPLCVYLVLRRLDEDIGRVAFVLLLAATLVGQFSISTEVFASFTLFGALTLGGALLLGGDELRQRLLPTVGLIAAAYVLTALVVSPYLYLAFKHVPAGPVRHLEKASVDLLGFVVPRQRTLIGGSTLQGFTRAFTLNNVEDGAYLGIPLVLAISLFAWSERKRRATWLLIALLVLLAVASLGPVLHIHGRSTIRLPWNLLAGVPLIQNALPERFTAYMWLVVAVVAALWLARAARGRRAKWAVVGLAALIILPSTPSPPFFPDTLMPAFFSQGMYREYLAPGQIVLPIPFSQGGPMLWQAEAGMYFRQAGAYLGPIPSQYASDRVVRYLYQNQPELIDPQMFSLYVTTHDVGAIVVADGYVGKWSRLIETLGVAPEHVGGLTLYRLQAVPGHPIERLSGASYLGDLRPGGTLKSFSLPGLVAGGTVTYGPFEGKPLVIEFFASWCPACIAELRGLVQAHRSLGHRVGFLAVAQSDRTKQAIAAVGRAEVRFPTASDSLGRFFGGFGGTTMPLTVFVGPHGRIVAVRAGPLSGKRLVSLAAGYFGVATSP